MLTAIAVTLLLLWLLGIIGVYTLGWFIHFLLAAAILMIMIQIVQDSNPVV